MLPMLLPCWGICRNKAEGARLDSVSATCPQPSSFHHSHHLSLPKAPGAERE